MIFKTPLECFCTSCEKPFIKYRRRGSMAICKSCANKKRIAAWVLANPDKKRASNQLWVAENLAKNRQLKADWAKRNPENTRQKQRFRGTRVRKATPKWACRSEILKMYKIAVRLSEVTGIEHHVDHVIPIHSDIVCGLHVQGNLRVISGDQNRSKSNHFEGNT